MYRQDADAAFSDGGGHSFDGAVSHVAGGEDTWQERTHFVANTRWWPPFCLVVDFVAAALIAIKILKAAG